MRHCTPWHCAPWHSRYSRGLAKGLADATRHRSDTLHGQLLSKCGKLLGLFVQHLELLSGVGCAKFDYFERRLRAPKLASNLKNCLHVGLSYFHHLAVIVPHMFY